MTKRTEHEQDAYDEGVELGYNRAWDEIDRQFRNPLDWDKTCTELAARLGVDRDLLVAFSNGDRNAGYLMKIDLEKKCG